MAFVAVTTERDESERLMGMKLGYGRSLALLAIVAIVICLVAMVVRSRGTWMNTFQGNIRNLPLSQSNGHSGRNEARELSGVRFVIGWGSGLHGYDTVAIEPDGSAVLLYRDMARGGEFRRTEFVVDGWTKQALDCLLSRPNGFFSLGTSYRSDVHDGNQVFVKIEWRDGRKSVFCSNHFPDAVIEVSDFVLENILTERVRGLRSHAVPDAYFEWSKLTGGSESF